jgi:hypothetical protein
MELTVCLDGGCCHQAFKQQLLGSAIGGALARLDSGWLPSPGEDAGYRGVAV